MEMAAEVEAIKRASNDLLVPTGYLGMNDNGSVEIIGTNQTEPFTPTDLAHSQIAEYLEIPKKYYDRMRAERPSLLAENVNTWFRKGPEAGAKVDRRMLRTVTRDKTPILRAFLSSGYRRLDNYDLMHVVIPFVMGEYGKPLDIRSCEVTETRLYLKIVAPHTERDINTMLVPGSHTRVNEPVRAGFIIQNSEVGMGAISASPFVEMLRCTNGMIVTEYGQRKYHSGKRNSGDGVEDMDAILSDSTKQLDDAAFWSRIKDVIRACVDEATVGKLFEKMAHARKLEIKAKPEAAVEVLANNFGLSEDERGGVLEHLIRAGMGYTAYGLSNAITEVAKLPNLTYDRATALEAMGGRIITLPPSEWKEIAEAA